MRGYKELIVLYLKLAFREKALLFFTYVFPLIFFFTFGQLMGAQSGAMSQVVAMVLVISVLGNGLFGAGIRTVAEREANVLRRYKVAPITPAPLLAASMITGWALFMPSLIMTLALAHFVYRMPVPERLVSLLIFVSLGALAMRAVGLIIASVVNTVAESNILVQSLYTPMLFLSGATFPLTFLPVWAQIISQFLPPSYLFSGVQGIILRKETLGDNAVAAAAMLVTTAVGTLLSIKLFRWEKEEKIAGRAKLWVLAVLLPFIVLGIQQAYSRENIARNKTYEREMRRSRARLIRGARIIVGDGSILESAAVLVRNGRIERVYAGAGPEPKSLPADAVDAYGKTLLPGLIDAHVHLAAPGGIPAGNEDDPKKSVNRRLAAYLYSGITAVRSAGDPLELVSSARRSIESGERLGAELYFTGPIFTTEGGYGTEYVRQVPEQFREAATSQFLRLPKNAAEAAQQVRELAAGGVNGIKVVLDSGTAEALFERLGTSVLRAITAEAHKMDLPVGCHTGDQRDVREAIDAGVSSIEHGSARELISPELFERMAKQGIYYVPTLAVVEAVGQFAQGRTDLLDRFLVAQVVPHAMLESTRRGLASPELKQRRARAGSLGIDLAKARENLVRAHRAGVRVVTGSDAGNMLVMHGPAVHRELQLWIESGIPSADAILGATATAARLLRADKRIGFVREGYEATLVLVDGNPLQEIAALERIDAVFLKGERIDRAGLFDQK
jgi:imidazolonepropionase-like amidohydrolase/ABC-type multidrug transport system permease subunit